MYDGISRAFFNRFDEETQVFIRRIIEDKERVYMEGYSPTLSKINEGIQSISESMQFLIKSVSSLQDITIKGQCPYCHGPLVANIKNQNTLILRCYSQSKPDCQANAWEIGSVRHTTP